VQINPVKNCAASKHIQPFVKSDKRSPAPAARIRQLPMTPARTWRVTSGHWAVVVRAAAYDSGVRTKTYLVTGVAAGVAGYLLGLAGPWCLAVGVGAPLLLAAAPRFLRGTLVGLSTPDDAAEEMSGTEFEDYVARIARSCGLPVIMTSITGDWGVDIIVGKRPNRLAIQCKRQSRPVGTSAIQEVVAGAPMQDCTKTMVVTNHEFTPAARKLAELHGCELVGRSELPRLRSTFRRLADPFKPTAA
jgi:restriction system protein